MINIPLFPVYATSDKLQTGQVSPCTSKYPAEALPQSALALHAFHSLLDHLSSPPGRPLLNVRVTTGPSGSSQAHNGGSRTAAQGRTVTPTPRTRPRPVEVRGRVLYTVGRQLISSIYTLVVRRGRQFEVSACSSATMYSYLLFFLAW